MKTLTLKHPIKFGETEVTELKFRDYVTAGDLLAFDERGANRQTIALIGNMTGADEALIKKLHHVDYKAADAIIVGMLNEDSDEKNS